MRTRLVVLALLVVAVLAVGLDRAGPLARDRGSPPPAASTTTLAEPAYTPQPAGFPDGDAPELGR